jgi:glucan phosphorylase
MRIRQELVLGVGGMRALQAMAIRPGILRLNEGHSAFALLELARQFMDRDGQSFENVRATVAAMSVFTTHTWWAEAFDGLNGFAIGDAGEHSDWGRQDERDAEMLYQALENEVVPLFYKRGDDGVPREWIHREKHALRALAWRFSAERMVTDYVRHCYLPAVGGTTSSFTSCPGTSTM